MHTNDTVGEILFDTYGAHRFIGNNLATEKEDVIGLYGGLFFLGVILSLAFGLAAVLIIYYKQISEGFEDRPRFEIMQKIGMTAAVILSF